MVKEQILSGSIVDENVEFTLSELCRASNRSAEWVIGLVEEGVIEPKCREQSQWRFGSASLRRVRIIQRLENDLGVNLPGAALALELLDEVEYLRKKLRRLNLFGYIPRSLERKLY